MDTTVAAPQPQSDYHKRFVAHARKQLDAETFDRIHVAARGSAGGAAPRTPRATADNDEQQQPINKSSTMSALTTMWAATVRALTGGEYVAVNKDSPTASEVHVNKPLGDEEPVTPPKRARGKKKVPPAKAETVDAPAGANPGGKEKKEPITKSSRWDALSRELAEADGIADEGFSIHLGAGAGREQGALGFDVRATNDPNVIPHDLGTGIPLPDGVVQRVFIAKSAMANDFVDADALLAEVKRVLRPDGQVVTDFPMMPPSGEQPSGLEVINKVIDRHPGPRPKISLAERLSNVRDVRKELVLKSVQRTMPLVGVNKQEQIIYAPALVPDEIHDSGDVISCEDIRYTAHNYMQFGRVVGAEHGREIMANVVESFVAPQDLHFDGTDTPYGAQTIPKGSWVVGVKVHDNDEWAKVMRGDYTGFSTGGFGVRRDEVA